MSESESRPTTGQLQPVQAQYDASHDANSSLAPRPYTAATLASARTSFTHVDSLDNQTIPAVPEGPHTEDLHGHEGSASVSGIAVAAIEAEAESEPVPQTPQTSLTFLLVSGRRRTMLFDPTTTIGRVKELVWNAWPSEWQDERPPAPSYLRILYLGKILQDDDTLTKIAFPTHIPSSSISTTPTSTIVHLSIRSYAPPSDDDALKKKGRRRLLGGGSTDTGGDPDGEGGEGRGCCSGCVIC